MIIHNSTEPKRTFAVYDKLKCGKIKNTTLVFFPQSFTQTNVKYELIEKYGFPESTWVTLH